MNLSYHGHVVTNLDAVLTWSATLWHCLIKKIIRKQHIKNSIKNILFIMYYLVYYHHPNYRLAYNGPTKARRTAPTQDVKD